MMFSDGHHHRLRERDFVAGNLFLLIINISNRNLGIVSIFS